MTAKLGATYVGQGQCDFLVWAPQAQTVQVHLITPEDRLVALAPAARGYHHARIDGVEPGSLYWYWLRDGVERPDPASRHQPQDVHGPSQVVDPAFDWQDRVWAGPALPDYIIYELHVGTFSQAGTFDAVIPHLGALHTFGVTAIELMPVAQFPGNRNWGYDGVYPFAVHTSYGGPVGLKRLVNACHSQGIAVVLDVVYNHLGPDGNYFSDFAPYFTNRYQTPWGQAVNFDGPHSDEVRRYFIENALYWIRDYHIDALRLDAVHAIADQSAYPFLAELARVVHEEAAALNRRVYLIAESDLNDARLLHAPVLGGYGLDAQWSDDFHHALHALVSGETEGYYQDFGTVGHLAKALREGYVYSGQYSAFRQRRHGNSSRAVAADQLVVCAQNHDQVGNRMLGERLSQLVSFEGLKLAAGVVLLSPFIPLLFMGEEYGEPAPFPYFVSHTEPELIAAVRQGRREEFASFGWNDEPPDPQSPEVFAGAKLHHVLRQSGEHAVLQAFYQTLIGLRRSVPALRRLDKDRLDICAFEAEKVLLMRRHDDCDAAMSGFNFSPHAATITLPWTLEPWHKRLDSADAQWHGPGSDVPVQLDAAAGSRLTLPPLAVVLFTSGREESGT